MAISTNGTVIARLAGGLYNTVLSNATYLEVASQDPSTLANTLYTRDFAKSTDLAVATTLVTNLGLSSVAGLANWVAAQLTAAGAANKGAKVVSLLNDFAGMTADTTYGAQATAFNTKVDAALAASQKTGAVAGVFADAGTVAVANATFTLTSGVDTGAAFTGGAGNDTFTANNAALGTLDSIDGGAGTNTLNITDSVSIPALNITATNIQTVNVTSTSGSIGTVAADATTAARQNVTYDFGATGISLGSSSSKKIVAVTVGGVTKTVGTAAAAATVADIAAAIDGILDDAYGASTWAAETSSGSGIITITAKTAGTALPAISFAAGSSTVSGTTTTGDGTFTATGSGVFKTTVQANQVEAAAVAASTFAVPTGATTATLNAATSVKASSVSTAATTATGADVTLSGGASQTITSSDSVYASGTKGAVVITNSTTPATGFYVAATTSGTGTGIKDAWGTSATSTQAGILVTGGSTVNITSTGGAISSTTKNVSSTNNTPVQVGSAPNYSDAGSLTGAQTIRNLGMDPTGNVVISNVKAHTDKTGYSNVLFGTGTAKVYTNGGTSVSVTGAGTTTITDVGTQTLAPSTGATPVAGTSKLSSVTLSGLSGDATITSDAITTVTVTDTLSARTINVNNSGTVGANSGAINLVVSNAGVSGSPIVLSDATATSVNLSSAAASAYQKIGGTTSSSNGTAINSGSKSYVNLTTGKATAVNLSNTLSVDIGDYLANAAKVATVDGSAATGGITATIAATPTQGTVFKGGSGADTVTIKASSDLSANSSTSAVTTVSLGAGNDKLLNGGSNSSNLLFTGATFDGGDGNDTVAISLLTAGNAAKFTNFETVGLDATSGSRDVSILTGVTGLSELASAASGATVTYTGVTTSMGLTVGTNITAAGTLALDFGSTVSGSSDAYTITFAGTGTTDATASATPIAAGKVTINGIEAVTIASGGSGYTANSIVLTDTSAKTLTVTGSQAANVSFTSSYFGAAITSSTSTTGVSAIDASALTGKLTIDTANVRTAYAGLTVTGGSNDDNITVAVQSDISGTLAGRVTVVAGAGNDIITTSTAATTLTGGSGNDTFKVSNTVATSAYATAPIYTTITDFAAGDTIEMGTVTVVSPKSTGIANIAAATSLEDAMAKAVYGNTTSGTSTWFSYGGNTYIVNDVDGNGFSAADIVVKLVGAFDLTLASSSGSGLVGVA